MGEGKWRKKRGPLHSLTQKPPSLPLPPCPQEQGNAAVKGKQLKEAVERYSEALALGSSAQYAAVLHSNRAAAHQVRMRGRRLCACG